MRPQNNPRLLLKFIFETSIIFNAISPPNINGLIRLLLTTLPLFSLRLSLRKAYSFSKTSAWINLGFVLMTEI